MRRSPSSSPTRWRRTSTAPAHFRKAGSPGNQYDFLQQFRANGGKFFDDDMKAQLASPAGVKTLKNMIAAEQGLDPRQQRARRRVALGGLAAGQGRDDLLLAADRTHVRRTTRRATRRSTSSRSRRSPARSATPSCRGNPEHATGYNKALAADSANPDAAYLFMQWAISPPVSLARVMLPYALRDPYRLSHFKSRALRRALARRAKDYLVNLNNSANVGLLDMIMPGWQDYALVDRPHVHVGLGRHRSRRRRSRRRRRNGTQTTERLGVDSQKAFYAEFQKLPGSTADHTVEKLGMAVKLD